MHSSSLVSTRLAPERAAGESKTGGPNGTGSASLTDAEIHGSSLVATRLAPSSKSQTPKAKRATNETTQKSASQSVSSFATRVKPGAKGGTPLLYVSPTCPHAHKAWLAALESGTEFDIRFEDLSAKSANLQDAFMDGTYEPEPLVAKVPVLKHEGRTLVESLLVASYVAKEFKSDVDYQNATEAYAGALFASQFNALTPLYMQALKAKNSTELNNKLDALRAQLRLRDRQRALALAQLRS